jgi:hypothetical protein
MPFVAESAPFPGVEGFFLGLPMLRLASGGC